MTARRKAEPEKLAEGDNPLRCHGCNREGRLVLLVPLLTAATRAGRFVEAQTGGIYACTRPSCGKVFGLDASDSYEPHPMILQYLGMVAKVAMEPAKRQEKPEQPEQFARPIPKVQPKL